MSRTTSGTSGASSPRNRDRDPDALNGQKGRSSALLPGEMLGVWFESARSVTLSSAFPRSELR